MLETTLFGHDGVPGDVLDRTADRVAFKIHEANALWREHRYLAITEEENVSSVLQNGGNIAGHEEFVLAQPYDDRRAKTRCDDLERITRGQSHECVRPAHYFHGFQNSFFKRRVFGILFDQVSDDLSVRLGEEFVAFFDELVF